MRFKAAVSSISPLSEHMEEVWVGCVYMQKMELHYWWVQGNKVWAALNNFVTIERITFNEVGK